MKGSEFPPRTRNGSSTASSARCPCGATEAWVLGSTSHSRSSMRTAGGSRFRARAGRVPPLRSICQCDGVKQERSFLRFEEMHMANPFVHVELQTNDLAKA